MDGRPGGSHSEASAITSKQKDDEAPKTFSSSVFSGLQALTQSRRDRNSSYECFEAHSSIVTSALFAPQNTSTLLEQSGLRAGLKASSTESITDELTAGESRARSVSMTADPTPSVLNPDKRTRSRSNMSTTDGLKRSTSMMSTNQRPKMQSDGKIIVTADYRGCIRVFENERAHRGYYSTSNPRSKRDSSNEDVSLDTDGQTASGSTSGSLKLRNSGFGTGITVIGGTGVSTPRQARSLSKTPVVDVDDSPLQKASMECTE